MWARAHAEEMSAVSFVTIAFNVFSFDDIVH